MSIKQPDTVRVSNNNIILAILLQPIALAAMIIFDVLKQCKLAVRAKIGCLRYNIISTQKPLAEKLYANRRNTLDNSRFRTSLRK